MRERWTVGVVCALLALLGALLTGCQQESGSATEDSGPSGKATPTRPSGYGAVFLAVDECRSFGRTSYTEVPCTGERAAARVVARYDGRVSTGPACPGTTDFVLHISAQRPPSGSSGDSAIRQGYACMRNLEPPHPGDPGGGGGPRTIVGDCVYSAGRGEVRETACDGSGKQRPEYKVAQAVRTRAECPPATALYVRLGADEPVGCAQRL